MAARRGSSTPGSPVSAEHDEDFADPNRVLISLCSEVLRDSHPRGMTTRDLAAALDRIGPGTPGFKSISSSVLSSKLNAFFRRYHSDSPNPTSSQLAELPLTREVSTDQPKRLVYTWTPPQDEDQGQSSTPSSDAEAETPEVETPLTPRPEDELPKSESGKKRSMEVTVAEEERPKKKQKAALFPRLPENAKNLYYDSVGVDLFVPPHAISAPSFDIDFTQEYDAPESLTFDDLDQLVC